MTRHRFLLASCAPALASILAVTSATALAQPPETPPDSYPSYGVEYLGQAQERLRDIREEIAEITARLEALLDGEGRTCNLARFLNDLERLQSRADEVGLFAEIDFEIRRRTRTAPRPTDISPARLRAAILERIARWRERQPECVRRARPAAPTGTSRAREGSRPPPPETPSNPAFNRLTTEAATILNRTLPAGCDLSALRAYIANLERLLAEARQALEGAEATGSQGVVDARGARSLVGALAMRLDSARFALRNCEERAAIAQPPTTSAPMPPLPPALPPPNPPPPPAADDDDPEYPDDDDAPRTPPPPPSPSDRAAALLNEARAAPRSCTDAALNAIIARLEALLAEAEASLRRYERYTAEWEDALATQLRVNDALREARALRDGACPPDGDGSVGSIFVIPGYQGFALPPTGIGVTRAGPTGAAPELPAAETPGTIPQFGAQMGIAPEGSDFSADIWYFEGRETRPFVIPSAAGTDTGRVNGALSPGGSSGIIGPFGLDGQTRTEGLSYGFRINIEVASTSGAGPSEATGESWSEFALRVFGEGVRQETTYAGTLAGRAVIGGTTFAFTQEREQEVDETRLGVGADGLLEVRIGGGVALIGEASAGVYHRWTNLASVERNTCSFCPAADRDFTIPIEDEDNGFGLHGTLRAGVDFRLSPRVSLGVRGSLDYWSRVGRVFNPNSGDQVFVERLTTGLRTADAWSWGVGAGLRIRLGPR